MRIAVIADIHGNLHALEAVLAQVESLQVDHLIVAGDIVNGAADSLGCWQRVKALGCPVLRGNHERYVFDLGTPRARPEWELPQFAPVHYAAAQLGADNIRQLAALPTQLRIPGVDDMLFVHASPRNDTDLVYPYTSDAEVATMFSGAVEPWIIRGHNHYCGVRLLGDRRIITTGSTGLPLDGRPRAQFLLLEKRLGAWAIHHQSVAYDVAGALRRFHELHYLEKGGVIARLFMREVETATFQITPYLKFLADTNAGTDMADLEAAFHAFLARQ